MIREILVLVLTIVFLNTARQRRLNKFRFTAPPYFLETIRPNPGSVLGANLNNKSPKARDLETFMVYLNSAEDRENFNYAEICLRSFLRRLARIARPDLVLIRFINPCLFFLLRFVNFIVVFIFNPY